MTTAAIGVKIAFTGAKCFINQYISFIGVFWPMRIVIEKTKEAV
jgi:hypothetical protein